MNSLFFTDSTVYFFHLDFVLLTLIMEIFAGRIMDFLASANMVVEVNWYQCLKIQGECASSHHNGYNVLHYLMNLRR